jgi:hypothetical protein
LSHGCIIRQIGFGPFDQGIIAFDCFFRLFFREMLSVGNGLVEACLGNLLSYGCIIRQIRFGPVYKVIL